MRHDSTVIDYSLEYGGQVTLKVYNMLGVEVATLVKGTQEAGKHSVSFGTANGTENLPSGVYYYRLESGAVTLVKSLKLPK